MHHQRYCHQSLAHVRLENTHVCLEELMSWDRNLYCYTYLVPIHSRMMLLNTQMSYEHQLHHGTTLVMLQKLLFRIQDSMNQAQLVF